jgi:uncharacterized membrane protein
LGIWSYGGVVTKLCKVVLLFAVLSLAPLVAAQGGTYTPLSFNGFYTFAFGINNAGDIVGDYTVDGNETHGFLLSGGYYTTIDYPGATFTFLFGINDVGQIVGSAAGRSGELKRGFVYEIATQTFTDFAFPGAERTQAYGLNNAGDVVGSYEVLHQQLVPRGFVFSGGTYSSLNVPASGSTELTGINDDGEIVGFATFDRGLVVESAVYFDGEFTKIGLPASVVYANGINGSGAVVGHFISSDGEAVGFVFENGAITRLKYPPGYPASPSGVNNFGLVVGQVVGGPVGGFLWTPPDHWPD